MPEHQLTVTKPAIPIAVSVITEVERASYLSREILGRSPSWVQRSGISALGAVIALGLFLSWLVRYPDSIDGKITVTGVNPAVAVVARQSGHLERLEVTERQVVPRGTLLGIIRNSADSAKVLKLKDQLARLQPFLMDPTKLVSLKLEGMTDLGSVQSGYSDFATQYLNYQALLADAHVQKTLDALRRQLVQKGTQLRQVREQDASMDREQQLAREAYERMKKLYQVKAISTAELEAQERLWLEAQRQRSSVGQNLGDAEIAVADCERQIAELSHQQSEQLRQARLALTEAVKKLGAAIEGWETDYVLRAPVDGSVAFYEFWSGQQYVTQGKTVFIVAPDSQMLIGRIPLKGTGVGKVVPGQVVRIQMDDYPYREFGIVTGKVRALSLVAQQGEQLVTAEINYPLRTHFGRELAFKQEMTGNASIITKDRRLLSRLFDELYRALSPPSSK